MYSLKYHRRDKVRHTIFTHSKSSTIFRVTAAGAAARRRNGRPASRGGGGGGGRRRRREFDVFHFERMAGIAAADPTPIPRQVPNLTR